MTESINVGKEKTLAILSKIKKASTKLSLTVGSGKTDKKLLQLIDVTLSDAEYILNSYKIILKDFWGFQELDNEYQKLKYEYENEI